MTFPQLLRGMFTRRPRLSALLDRIHPDPQGIRLVRELRQRHASDYLWLDVAGKASLLVLDPDAIRHVLDASPDIYGPPDLKVRGMSHFQPGAVTISVGDDWRRRRAFNDEVLGVGQPIHPPAAELLGVVEREVARILPAGSVTVGWPDLHAMFGRLTVGVVFGPDAEAGDVLSRLDALLRRANRLVGTTDTAELHAFRDEILRRVCAPEAGGLSTAACPHVGSGDPLPVAGQVPHWLFAMKDTLATNCAYALALVAAHEPVQEVARREAERFDASDPAAVERMDYLDGCLREAMRLWPTTPMIVRKALRDDEVHGRPVAAGSQVIIHNGYNHRDPDAFAEPDAYRPERWEPGVWDDRFNAMSNGPQACAGRELALFVGKAVLARFLRSHRWALARPALEAGRPIPHAFRHSALSLVATAV